MPIVVACEPTNDLYAILAAAGTPTRCADAETAIRQAPDGGAVLLLASGYPDTPAVLDDSVWACVKQKGLRVYAEYPGSLPGLEIGPPRGTEWERAVVASGAFGEALERLRILAIHDCRYVEARAASPHLAMARVAGFDTAVFGLPGDASPILFEHPDGGVLVATTKLSQFVTGRYAPGDAWAVVWRYILKWVTRGEWDRPVEWQPAVRPSFSPDVSLPQGIERRALDRAAGWFFRARLFPHADWPDDRASWKDRAGPMPEPEWPLGDGSLGMLEGYASCIHYTGAQHMRWWKRNDCMCEGTMALAFGAKLTNSKRARTTAENLGDFVFFHSDVTKGPRDDPESPAYGLMSWDITANHGVYYGDDNARGMLSAWAAGALLDTDRWDRKIMRCMLANLRTTGPSGFRGGRIDQGPLDKNGWRHYFTTDRVNPAPHYESYLWACYLLAYRETGYRPFLDRAKTAIGICMERYPDGWVWTNGLQQERARLMLCLAWLVRIEDTQTHRDWLGRIAGDLLEAQAECGAIREELGPEGKGHYAPPASNEAYGVTEAPLIQENGDPLCDLLYTTNFAFLALHEAAAATGDAGYKAAEDRLAQFLCRVQVRSETHPELDGAWFRAFDFERWEYWASNADAGWGAWSIESGWTCGWITAVFGLRAMDTSLWDLTRGTNIATHLHELEPVMMAGYSLLEPGEE